jgi:hypothetical protein
MTAAQGNGLSWKERLYVQFARQDTTMEAILRGAAARGLRLNRNTASKILRGAMAPNDRFVAAVSVVLGIHPEDLGFDRSPATELGFRAFEAEHPDEAERRRCQAADRARAETMRQHGRGGRQRPPARRELAPTG